MSSSTHSKGCRFVATRAFKVLRYLEQSPIVEHISDGAYLALYWILDGHHEATERWLVDQVNALIRNDRMLDTRVPVHAGFYHHRWSFSRAPDGVPAELALDHPYTGMVMLMIDRAEGVDAEEIDCFFRDGLLPERLPGSDCYGDELW